MAESEADLAYLTDLVRTYDRPRYFSVLFAPRGLQDALFALYAFAAEIGRIPDQVKDATLGEIRLQWWHDSLEGAVAGQGAANPTLRAAADVISRHALPLPALLAMIDARTADLYSDPPPALVDLEVRLGKTESATFQLAAIVCGSRGPESAEAAGHAGIAYGMAARLATISAARARGRTFVPLESLAREALGIPDVLAATPRPEVMRVVGHMVDHGRYHLDLARRHLRSAPRSVRPAFVPLAVVEPWLSRIAREGTALLHSPVTLADITMLTRIGLAKLSGLGKGTEPRG